ncbi:hypothetical protein [Methylobacterium indicum]|uniref:Flagellar protein FlaG n=1 Tax=Methylobacterium indicum TaxID=1775910 RepID=A0ABR5HGC5_9HYPH|nr:hypothetical protein [Methylobacterium indicum]KMO22607.1 hypothetical protein QR78_06550 [Methylobacterium indicum]KMO25592.1 hypothetical protein QR79_06960 [Methylobacterium indicum]
MIETSTLSATFPLAAVEPAMRINAERPRRDAADPPLDPPVTLDLSPGAKTSAAKTSTTATTATPDDGTAAKDSVAAKDAPASAEPEPTALTARFRRDLDTQQMVFQIVGRDGAVIEQLPSEAFLRARTYAREVEAAGKAEIGTTVARTA